MLYFSLSDANVDPDIGVANTTKTTASPTASKYESLPFLGFATTNVFVCVFVCEGGRGLALD